MVRYKARPQRDPQFSIPINVNPDGSLADEVGPSTAPGSETSSEEDVPLGQRLFRPPKRSKLDQQLQVNGQPQQQPVSAEQTWNLGSSKVCQCDSVKPHELYAFKAISLERLPAALPVNVTGNQQLHIIASCYGSQQTEIDLLVVPRHGQQHQVSHQRSDPAGIDGQHSFHTPAHEWQPTCMALWS